MIKIELSETQIGNIKKKHFEWFNDYFKQNIKSEDGKFSYRNSDNTNNHSNFCKIESDDINSFLIHITEVIKLENIVIGNSIRAIIEDILKLFPKIFSFTVNNSLKEFLKTQKNILKNYKNTSTLKNIQNKMKKYYKSNEEILSIYYDYDTKNILNKIEEIKFTNKKILNFNIIDKYMSPKYSIHESEKLFEVFKDIMFKIFNYKEFISFKTDNWSAYALLKELNINTCPYCNRNFIQTYIYDKNNKMRAEIDHFYPKSKYPYLSVSLYNFIPSCHICNSSFKKTIDTFFIPHLYPYNDGLDKYAQFKTEFLTDDLDNSKKYDIRYLLGNSNNFSINIDINNCNNKTKERINNSINTFQIINLYELHKDYIRELIKKSIIYNKSRINELYREYEALFTSKEELIQVLFSNYLDNNNIKNRPLSKLTIDICEELGLKNKI